MTCKFIAMLSLPFLQNKHYTITNLWPARTVQFNRLYRKFVPRPWKIQLALDQSECSVGNGCHPPSFFLPPGTVRLLSWIQQLDDSKKTQVRYTQAPRHRLLETALLTVQVPVATLNAPAGDVEICCDRRIQSETTQLLCSANCPRYD